METLGTAIITAGVVAVLTFLVTFSYVEAGWKTDCEKIGMHVAASSGLKVYKCELVPEKK